MICLDMVLILW